MAKYAKVCMMIFVSQLSTGHPQGFSVTAASLQISLDFEMKFSNVLSVIVITEKRIEKSVQEFHLKLETVSVSTKASFVSPE
jgi:hypothetical protein